MKKVYITGICGLLGNNIVKELAGKYELYGADLAEQKPDEKLCKVDAINLCDYESLKRSILGVNPDVVVHTAAAVNVDKCETDRDYAYSLNVELTKNIADICKENNIKLIYISTDAVFAGDKDGLYVESDITGPINYYGETKLLGEYEVEKVPDSLILRTNIYGTNIQPKNSFGEWIVESLMEDKTLNMFTDILFSPILVNELAGIIDKAIEMNLSGMYHACGTGSISKYDFGVKVKEIFGIETGTINKSTSDTMKFIAARSKNMGMDNSRIKEVLGINISTPIESIEKFKNIKSQIN